MYIVFIWPTSFCFMQEFIQLQKVFWRPSSLDDYDPLAAAMLNKC